MKEEYVINRQGKDYVLFAGLLDEWHRKYAMYSRSIETELITEPNEMNNNTAVVKARVKAWDHDAGQSDNNEEYIFEGIGDANPANVGPGIMKHIIRMAETRAKARALRDAINVGATAFEELGEGGAGGEAPVENGGLRSVEDHRKEQILAQMESEVRNQGYDQRAVSRALERWRTEPTEELERKLTSLRGEA